MIWIKSCLIQRLSIYLLCSPFLALISIRKCIGFGSCKPGLIIPARIPMPYVNLVLTLLKLGFLIKDGDTIPVLGVVLRIKGDNKCESICMEKVLRKQSSFNFHH